MKKVYYGKAVYDNKEINAVLNVLKKNSLSLVDGQNVKKLEKTVAKLFGKKYGLMVNSGSSANLLAIASLNSFIKPMAASISTRLLKDRSFPFSFSSISSKLPWNWAA